MLEAIRSYFLREESSRVPALLRIGFSIILWSRWAGEIRQHPSTLFSVAFFAASLLMGIGFWSRTSTLITGFLSWLLYLQYHEKFGYGHHTYFLFMITMLLSLTACGKSFSVDRWIEISRRKKCGMSPPPEEGPSWALKLIGLQVSAMYIWGTLSKLNPLFLSGCTIEAVIRQHFFGSDAVPVPIFAVMGLTLTTLLLEPLLALGLWWRTRSQKWLMLSGIVFHAAIYYLITVRTFSISVVICYLVFLSPKVVHVAIDRMAGVS